MSVGTILLIIVLLMLIGASGLAAQQDLGYGQAEASG